MVPLSFPCRVLGISCSLDDSLYYSKGAEAFGEGVKL